MILYFTGTGNSRYLAKKIAAETGEELFCINEKIKAGETGEIKVHGNLIFVTPTYAWRIPKLVREWILHTDFTGVNRVWFVMNCGDSIGKADSYNQKLCMQKGWEYMGTLQITMPENYIAMFPVPEPKESKRIIEEAGPVIKKAIQCIGTGEKTVLIVWPVSVPVPEKPLSMEKRVLEKYVIIVNKRRYRYVIGKSKKIFGRTGISGSCN